MKLTRNTLYALIQLLALRLPNVAVMLLLTRRHGAYETGVFGLAVTYALLLTVWWAGPDELAVREMARARASRALRHYAWRRLLIATALCAAAIAFTWLWGSYPPETRWFVAIVLLGTIPEGPMGVIQAGLLGYERFRPAMLVSLVQTALRLLLCGAALLAGGSLIWVAIGWTAASFASSLIALFALGDVLRQGGAELEAPGIDWRREGWAFVSIGILATLEYQVDVVLLSYFRSISEVGFYSAALTLFGAASLPAQAARLAVLPAMTRAAGGQAESLARLYRRTLRYLLALALPVAVLGGAFADRLVVLIFGPAMRPTGRVLAILMVALPLVFLNV
ncbi:MAG TPA: oligosaccharide flippase family protein, partial [Ardenticatenaceae bacterium]|nr:oligosaccharide flippase family protein [Ardenticatenaceae bacterium]